MMKGKESPVKWKSSSMQNRIHMVKLTIALKCNIKCTMHGLSHYYVISRVEVHRCIVLTILTYNQSVHKHERSQVFMITKLQHC